MISENVVFLLLFKELFIEGTHIRHRHSMSKCIHFGCHGNNVCLLVAMETRRKVRYLINKIELNF